MRSGYEGFLEGMARAPALRDDPNARKRARGEAKGARDRLGVEASTRAGRRSERAGRLRTEPNRVSGGDRLELVDAGLAALNQYLVNALLGADREVGDLFGDRDRLLDAALGVGQHGLNLGQLLDRSSVPPTTSG